MQSIGIDEDCVRDHLKRNFKKEILTPGNKSFCGVFSTVCKDYVEWQSSIDSGGNRILKGAPVHVSPQYDLQNTRNLFLWRVLKWV